MLITSKKNLEIVDGNLTKNFYEDLVEEPRVLVDFEFFSKNCLILGRRLDQAFA